MSLLTDRLSLMDPRHNAREVCKQLLLLEDHLAHAEKRCPDCVRKHFLMAEALADEGVALDPTGNYAAMLSFAGDYCRALVARLVDGADPSWAAGELRLMRKAMTAAVFDPR